MARRKAKKTRKARSKRASYRVRSTKAGQRRYSARKAYRPVRAKRRAARRNPKGIFASPAVKYSLATAAGFAAASYADNWDMLNPVDSEGKPRLPFGLKGSALASVITFVLAQYAIKGAANKNYARAAAIGMIAPTAINMAKEAVAPKNGGAAYNLPRQGKIARLAPSRRAAVNFTCASNALDNCA